MTNKKLTGDQLRDERIKFGLTQSECAEILGLESGVSVYRMEAGKRNITTQTEMLWEAYKKQKKVQKKRK